MKGAISAGRIVNMKSFTESSCDDTYGHGTHVVRAFLRVAPHAKLYIAKISDSKEIPRAQIPVLGEVLIHPLS
jgi:hypothetical protein